MTPSALGEHVNARYCGEVISIGGKRHGWLFNDDVVTGGSFCVKTLTLSAINRELARLRKKFGVKQ